MNGGRIEYNNWELDGGDNMDNGSNGTLNVYPSIDAIAEFKVLTSNYGAQYGRNGSGTVEVETKGGTKRFPRRRVRVRPQRRLQRARTYFNSSHRWRHRHRASVQEERFRLHPRRSGLHSQRLQRQERENILLLVAGMAARSSARNSFNVPVPYSAERTGDFSDVCPNPQNRVYGGLSHRSDAQALPTTEAGSSSRRPRRRKPCCR